MTRFITTILSLALLGGASDSKISAPHPLWGGELPVVTVRPQLDTNTVNLLARLVVSEASIEGPSGRLAVAQVVVNRSRAWNRTIPEIIFQPGQFDGIHTPNFAQEAPAWAVRVARAAILGAGPLSPRTLFYYNPTTSTDTAFISSISHLPAITIGRHRFVQARPG